MTMLHLLPQEVITLIGSFCSSADAVNLAMTCSSMAAILIPTVYRCIVVDPVPRTLHEARTYRSVYVPSGKRLLPVTMVHTIAGFKCLLTTLTNNLRLASQVRSLSVRGNIAMSDIVLIPKVQEVLRNLVHLNEFEWTACPELPPSILCSIHQHSDSANNELLALVVDLASRPGENLPRISFPNLQRLYMKPYLGPELLNWIREISLNSEGLEDLQLCRYLDTKVEVGSSFTFVGRSDIYRRSLIVPAISIFFDSTVRRKLRTLKLNQIDTSVDDCSKLRSSVDLTELAELQLIGSGREDEYSHGIIRHLTELGPSLRKIDISWDCSIQTLHEFWKSCAITTEHLKIAIRKQPKQILDTVALTCVNLKHLEIEMHCDFKLADLEGLKSLNHLEVIKLPFNHLVSSWEICEKFANLKLLVLNTQTTHNTSSSYNRNWPSSPQGLGLLAGSALVDWDSQFCSQLQNTNLAGATSVNASLQYLIVDGRTTQLKRGAPPLETYSW